ncbi:MAG: hypothetical protein ACKO5P_10200 [Nodosilinea sp.]
MVLPPDMLLRLYLPIGAVIGTGMGLGWLLMRLEQSQRGSSSNIKSA